MAKKDSPPAPKVVQIGNVDYILAFDGAIDWDPRDRARIRQTVKERGVDLAIVLWEERSRHNPDSGRQEETVLDGAGRCEGAAAAGLEFIPHVYKSFKEEEDAREWVKSVNIRDRGHLERDAVEKERERERSERVERVAAARQQGQSIRTIAETENVSIGQVQRDLEKATVSGGYSSPPDGKVTGKDGRTRPAHQAPVKCDKCKRLNLSNPDCPQCVALAEAKQKAKKKKKAPSKKEDIKDRTGAVVPEGCRDAFAAEDIPDLIGELEAVEVMLDAEKWTEKAIRLVDHYPFLLHMEVRTHAWNAKEAVQAVLGAFRAALPYAVCPKCEGKKKSQSGADCRTCRGSGHIPEHRWKELQEAVK